MQIHRILVPVDFSDVSSAALDHAVDLALVVGAEIDLLHCHPMPAMAVPPYGPVLPSDVDQAMRESARARLAGVADQVRERGIAVKAHLSADVPVRAIGDAVDELGIDLIVMGTRGLSGLRHVLLGSVAERTVRTAPCPVITVPVHADGH
jgi:nucleotide-binding universal stress UspA family protein